MVPVQMYPAPLPHAVLALGLRTQGLMGLSNLKDLNLSKCEIVKLPDPFGERFHSLTTLNLSNNHMFLLPEKFTRMTSLTRLELSHMRLISLATVPAVNIPGEQVEDLGDLREWQEVRPGLCAGTPLLRFLS